MNANDFAPGSPGKLVQVAFRTGSGVAYVPDALPPNLSFDQDIALANERAALALGNLNGSAQWLPNPTLLLRPFMSREALSSSRIEGTNADYDQLVLFEAAENNAGSDPDAQEVSNYIDALQAAWSRSPEQPFSPGFMMQVHGILMSGVRGADKNPGQLRGVQVVIGRRGRDAQDARFVPPPPEFVRPLLDDLCAFVNQSKGIPDLVRLALFHYQFETIHPFEDGNGRLGRLLLPVILGQWGKLRQPLLYLSEYFEDNRDTYVDLMLEVSQRGTWNDWILFTLNGIEEQANDAVRRGIALLNYREELRARFQESRSPTIQQAIDLLFQRPAITGNELAAHAGVTPAAALRTIDRLVASKVLVESTGWKRNRIFFAPSIIDVILDRRSID